MATIRQKRRAQIIGKNSTIKAELLEAGYAPSTARHQPPSVTKAKNWKELVEQYLPDDKLLTIHNEALQAEKQTKTGAQVPDHQTRLRAVELGLKVKGKLTEKVDHTTNGKDMPVPIYGGKSTQSDE